MYTVYSVLRANWDQFSFLSNRARYEFIELDMSTILDLSIPSSRPLTFPGGQRDQFSFLGNRGKMGLTGLHDSPARV